MTTETYSNLINDVIHTIDDLVKTKPVSRPHIKNMLDTNVNVDEESQSFKTPRKHNHSVAAPSAQVLLRSDTLQYYHNITTHITYQKLPLS